MRRESLPQPADVRADDELMRLSAAGIYHDDPGIKLRAGVSAFAGGRRLVRSLGHILSFQAWRSRSALPMTDTELSAMAAPAIIGLSSSPKSGYKRPAASGMPSVL